LEVEPGSAAPSSDSKKADRRTCPRDSENGQFGLHGKPESRPQSDEGRSPASPAGAVAMKRLRRSKTADIGLRATNAICGNLRNLWIVVFEDHSQITQIFAD